MQDHYHSKKKAPEVAAIYMGHKSIFVPKEALEVAVMYISYKALPFQ
jgi:hypothetical protein